MSKDKPDSQIVLDNFPGLVTAAEPHDLPAGAAVVQINLTCTWGGALESRGGLREVTFEE